MEYITKIVLPGLEKLKTDGTLGRLLLIKQDWLFLFTLTDSTKFISHNVASSAGSQI